MEYLPPKKKGLMYIKEGNKLKKKKDDGCYACKC